MSAINEINKSIHTEGTSSYSTTEFEIKIMLVLFIYYLKATASRQTLQRMKTMSFVILNSNKKDAANCVSTLKKGAKAKAADEVVP